MGTKRKTTKTTKRIVGTPVVITGWALTDEAIDALIDASFRMVERMMQDPRVLVLAKLALAFR